MQQVTEEQIKEFAKEYCKPRGYKQIVYASIAFQEGFKKAMELLQPPATKPLSEITDEDATELATIVLFDPKIEDWNPDEVWSAEGNTEGDFYFLEVGMRCWSGVLVIKEKSGSIALFDEDENLMEIYNLVSVVDFLRSKGYILPTQTA